MFSFLSKSYVSVTPCGEPPQFALPTPGKHSWWHGQTVPIGGGECCSEYNCTSCGAFREEIFGNGVDTCWGEGDTEMHQERGEDEDGETVILEGCGADVRGAHALGHNRKLGITVFGNGMSLSVAVMDGIEHLVKTYCPGRPVLPHRRVSKAGKTCPGDVVTAWVESRWPGGIAA